MMDDFLALDHPILEKAKARELFLRKWELMCTDVTEEMLEELKSLKSSSNIPNCSGKPDWKSMIYHADNKLKNNKYFNFTEEEDISQMHEEDEAMEKVRQKVFEMNPELYEKLDLFYDHRKDMEAAKNVSEYYYGYKYYASVRPKKINTKTNYLSNEDAISNKGHIQMEGTNMQTNQKNTRLSRAIKTDTEENCHLTDKRNKRTHKKKKSIMNEELFKSLNCLEKRSHKRKAKDTAHQSDSNLDGNSADSFKEKSFLPTGVFYSRICRSIIANWIDDKTKRQIKVPFKIMDYGLQRSSIYAIIARCLRVSELEKVIEHYNALSNDQIQKIIAAMAEATWPEKMYTAIIQGEYDEYMKIEKRFASLMSLSKNDESLNHMWKPQKGKEHIINETTDLETTLDMTEHEKYRGFKQKPDDNEQETEREREREREREIKKEEKALEENKNRMNEEDVDLIIDEVVKGRPMKRSKTKINGLQDKEISSSERKRIKTSDADGPLPIGVYFYQGAYVANWWETTVKKQHKVPFKISEYGGKLAKTLAVVSRTLRSSNVNDVKYILTKMDKQENCIKLDYISLASMAIKTYRSLKGKKQDTASNDVDENEK